jgi:hypothetical protein
MRKKLLRIFNLLIFSSESPLVLVTEYWMQDNPLQNDEAIRGIPCTIPRRLLEANVKALVISKPPWTSFQVTYCK